MSDNKRKLPHSAWKKGGPTPNPGGKPKKNVVLVNAARALTGPAIAALVDVMTTGSGSERVSAARLLLAYGWGNPSSSLTVDVTSTNINMSLSPANLSNLTDAQLEAWLDIQRQLDEKVVDALPNPTPTAALQEVNPGDKDE